MRRTLLPRLLLLGAAVLLAVLTLCNPLLRESSVKTLNAKDKTEAFAPGDVLEQDFTAAGTLESVDLRLETAPSASGGITLQVSLLRGAQTAASGSLDLAKKKAKSWISLPAENAPAGAYTLRIEVQGEGTVKLGGGSGDQPAARLNGEALPLSLDLQLKGTTKSHNRQLLLLSAVLALLALIPAGGRRKAHA